MWCAQCQANSSKVLDSRSSNSGRVIRRRRECLECGHRFTTREYIEEVPLMVIKNDGRREPFDREKIRAGIRLACKKRPVAAERIEGLVERIETQLRGNNYYECPAEEIGSEIMKELRTLDEIAYVRFASVYRQFQDKEEFINELRGLGEENPQQ